MPRSLLKVAFMTPVAVLGIGMILLLCAGAAAAAVATLLARAARRALLHARHTVARDYPARMAPRDEPEEKPAAASRAG